MIFFSLQSAPLCGTAAAAQSQTVNVFPFCCNFYLLILTATFLNSANSIFFIYLNMLHVVLSQG